MSPCANVVCATPPANTCIGSTARTWSSNGTCSNGGCSYTSLDTVCANGCSGAGVCNGPACGVGRCDAPPANACLDSNRLTRYASLGTCATGACTYRTSTVACSNGCFNGACIAGSWETESPPFTGELNRSDLVFDAAGTLHLAGCDANNAVVYRAHDAYGWREETVDPGMGSRCHVSLRVSPTGIPTLAYFDSNNGDLRFAQRVSGAWSVRELVANQGTVGAGASLAFDDQGRALVSAASYDPQVAGSTKLILFTRTGANAWSPLTVSTSQHDGSDALTQLHLDAQGRKRILVGRSTLAMQSLCLQNGTRRVWVAIETATGWAEQEIATGACAVRGGLGTTVDGDLRVAYVSGNDLRMRTLSPTAPFDELARPSAPAKSWAALLDTQGPPLYAFGYYFASGNHGPVVLGGRINDAWSGAALGADSPFAIALRPDRRIATATLRGEIVTSPAATSCGARVCGQALTGESCGSCGAGLACSTAGTCTRWGHETVRGMEFTTAYLALSVGADGTIHAAGNVNNGQYNGAATYTRRTSAGWEPVNPVGSFVSSIRPISGAPDGTAVGAYFSGQSDYGVLSPRGGLASKTPLSPMLASSGPAPAVAVDAQGKTHVLSASTASGFAVDYWKANGAAWVHEVVSSSPDHRVKELDLALDGSGKAHAVWVETPVASGSARIRYGTNATGAWVAETIEVRAAGDLPSLQLGLDAQGVPQVLFQSLGAEVRWGKRGAAGWLTEQVSVGTSLYGAPGFAIDPAGRPWIVYRWAQPGPLPHLAVAWRTGALAWTTEELPVGYPVDGQASAIAFDANGKAMVLAWDDRQARLYRRQ